MPCNGLNHHQDCNCRFGGQYFGSGELNESPDWSRQSSHTVPNAKCPHCRSQVFFYRSPDGGRVFFDSLGPPWPKHDCRNQEGVKSPPGWWPFLLNDIVPLPKPGGVALQDTADRVLITRAKPSNFRIDTPVWVQAVPTQRGVYRLSTLITKAGVTEQREFQAITLDLLSEPEHARHFQGVVKLFLGSTKHRPD